MTTKKQNKLLASMLDEAYRSKDTAFLKHTITCIAEAIDKNPSIDIDTVPYALLTLREIQHRLNEAGVEFPRIPKYDRKNVPMNRDSINAEIAGELM